MVFQFRLLVLKGVCFEMFPDWWIGTCIFPPNAFSLKHLEVSCWNPSGYIPQGSLVVAISPEMTDAMTPIFCRTIHAYIVYSYIQTYIYHKIGHIDIGVFYFLPWDGHGILSRIMISTGNPGKLESLHRELAVLFKEKRYRTVRIVKNRGWFFTVRIIPFGNSMEFPAAQLEVGSRRVRAVISGRVKYFCDVTWHQPKQ